MKQFSYIILLLCFAGCSHSNHKSNEEGNSSANMNTTEAVMPAKQAAAKLTVLVLPPFDEIANAGISPDVRNDVEAEISKDTSLTVIPFPYKQLMNVPYLNVFDKKYCPPIINKIKTDIIVMSKLEQTASTGQMQKDKWNLHIRIYHVNADQQINSTIVLRNLNGTELKEMLRTAHETLINELKSSE